MTNLVPQGQELNDSRPKVYVGEQTGSFYAAFCNTGQQLAEGIDAVGPCCHSLGCVCMADEDFNFRQATVDETRLFFRTAALMTAYAQIERLRDL